MLSAWTNKNIFTNDKLFTGYVVHVHCACVYVVHFIDIVPLIKRGGVQFATQSVAILQEFGRKNFLFGYLCTCVLVYLCICTCVFVYLYLQCSVLQSSWCGKRLLEERRDDSSSQ